MVKRIQLIFHHPAVYIFLSFFIPLFVYVRTLAPTVVFGDSGELTPAAVKLGIPHPPGFPLWTFLAHFFSYIPYRTGAWRINFSSAVFAATASALLFLFLSTSAHYFLNKKKSPLIYFTSLIFSLLFAFSGTAWS